MRRPIPDPDALVAALAGRIDRLEQTSRSHSTDIGALGHGIAGLFEQLRLRADERATTTPSIPAGAPRDGAAAHRSPSSASEPSTAGSPPAVSDDLAGGQRDWLAVTDPDVAAAWIIEADQWARDVLNRHSLVLAATPCWPLHPDVVADLLALIAQRLDAYTGDKPAGVSEWLTRWLPAGIERIRSRLAGCLAERGHHHDGHLYNATSLDPAHAAAWWATDRRTPAPPALTLPRID